MSSNLHLLSFGHGYSAQALSRRLTSGKTAKNAWKITGTTRHQANYAQIGRSGADCCLWPGADLRSKIRNATHILVSVPPDECGDPVLRQFSVELAAAASRLKWVGVLSTTAVYGDSKGAWVDEHTPPDPTTDRGQQRIAAEQAWRTLAQRSGLRLHIFRLSGIYGPDRGPLAQIQSGKKTTQVIKHGQIFNRIHVDDIAQILAASIETPTPGSIYNVCDDLPAAPEDVTDFACTKPGQDPLERIDLNKAQLSPMARSFFAESKRVRNRLVKDDLGITLFYPDYETGLRALIENSSTKGRGPHVSGKKSKSAAHCDTDKTE